jgi:Kef-type K+ transport system membrane component KefB
VTKTLRLGTLMNCRGVTELVMASVGLSYHVINALEGRSSSPVQW